MTDPQTKTRSQTHEIALAATPEAVWAAITDAEELTRWFVEAARVEPGVGGTISISWDGPAEGPGSRIEVWEPNRQLRVRLAPRNGFYDGTNSGWPQFFRTLRHYLEHHAGQPRSVIKTVGTLPGTSQEAWARLTGPSGLGFEPVAGRAFSTTIGAGETLSGEVVAAKMPNLLDLTIREFGDALLAHSMSGAGGSHYVYTTLSVYGKSASEVQAIRARWQDWLNTLLGLAPASAPDGLSAERG